MQTVQTDPDEKCPISSGSSLFAKVPVCRYPVPLMLLSKHSDLACDWILVNENVCYINEMPYNQDFS